MCGVVVCMSGGRQSGGGNARYPHFVMTHIHIKQVCFTVNPIYFTVNKFITRSSFHEGSRS
jgi:hypothetical protein